MDFTEVARAKPILASPKDKSVIYVNLGENVTVKCMAYSQGNLHFQLLRITNQSMNGTKIKVLHKPTTFQRDAIDDPDEAMRKNIAVFYFSNITEEDLGLFACMVGNPIGYSTSQFSLKIRPTTTTLLTTHAPGWLLTFIENFQFTYT